MSDTEVEKTENNKYITKRKLGKSILDHFSNLTKAEENVRVRGASNLLKHLTNVTNSEKDKEVKYALGRLIRGLGASTSNARTGFYTALSCLLNLDESITTDDIFELVTKHLRATGSSTKSENADVATGQILACGAIIRSSLWSRCAEEQKKKVVELILKECKERNYLAFIAYTFILNGLGKVKGKELKKLIPPIEAEVTRPLSEYNLDLLFLLYGIKEIKPNGISKWINSGEIVCVENAECLSNILMRIQRINLLKHPVYEQVSKDIAVSSSLPDIVNALDNLIQQPNRNRQMIINTIYNFILKNITDHSIIPDLLTKNFIQHNLEYLKSLQRPNEDPEFKQKFDSFLTELLEAMKHEEVTDKIKITVLKKLIVSPGTLNFEKITSSKVVQQIALTLTSKGVRKLAVVYRTVINAHGKDESGDKEKNWLNNDRLYATHMLVKLLNSPSVKEENEFKIEQLTYLMELALLKDNSCDVHLGYELTAAIKKAFFGSLDMKLTKLEDLQFILSSLVKHLHTKMAASGATLNNQLTEEVREVWDKTIYIIDKIEKKTHKNKLKNVFLTLFLHLGLQLFNETKLAIDSLQELFVCYEKVKTSRKQTSHEEDDLPWIEVVIDLFLNLLSHNSHLLRRLIKSVFPYLCEYMTNITTQQILSVLDPKNKDNILSKYNNESSDEDSDKEDEDSNKEDEENEEESGVSDSEVEEDEDIDESNTDKLRLALQEILRGKGTDTDEESIDLDEMSETEAEKLDAALASAFKKFKPNHGNLKKQTKEQEMLTHFRIRVLDLIEIYLNSNPSLLLTLEIMLPLLQAFEFSVKEEHQKPLQARLKPCLKQLSKLKKFSSVEGVDDNTLSELLKSLMDKGTKNAWIVQDMAVQLADCTIFTIRCADLLLKKSVKKCICAVISEEMNKYFHQRDCATHFVLFKNLVQTNWDGLLKLVPQLFKFLFEEDLKPFKKKQVLELLRLFYQNQRYLSSNAEVIKQKLNDEHLKFFENVKSHFRELVEKEGNDNLKDIYLVGIFNLLSAVKMSCLKIENLDWKGLAEVIREYRSYKNLSNDARTAFNKLCNHCGVSNKIEMKVTGQSKNKKEETSEATQKNKTKKRKNTELMKQRKEAKKLRLASLSSGLGEVHFPNELVDVELESDEEQSKEADAVKNKKRNLVNGDVTSEDTIDEVESDKKVKKSKKKSKVNGGV
ncbi:unnamed protein product [Acanthoscelides obtectus]|uniref:DNA polymerase V n=1 Tax=Acanthoscelides obtectus TaxID=200917 RepID=A0A9P0JZ01_ACAOB|nr:unnamed protein product [Acanthoscelides obtectus]CAK1639090.1 Myb-binding protein 1A [Acanthoscelides obtectus]